MSVFDPFLPLGLGQIGPIADTSRRGHRKDVLGDKFSVERNEETRTPRRTEELRAFGLSAMFGLFAVLGLFRVALRPLNVLTIVLLVLYSSLKFVRGYAARKRRLASRLK